MLEALILGLGAGIISSFLTGPVFFTMIKTAIEKGFKAGFSIAVGVILSDVILVTIVLFGSQFLTYQSSFDKYVGIAGGVFMLGVGVYYVFSKLTLSPEEDPTYKISKRNYLLKGFLMCLLTPSTLMFWVVVSGIITVKLNNNFYDKLFCLLIAMLTQLSIDFIKTYYASKLREKIKDNSLVKLNKTAGVIILVFGIWLIIKTYLKFY
ncbi:MAG: LysE family transporter [Sphingobacteriaceae bacterium]|nr:LysE family transporter [Sphingobacteriaceae bacterium]